MKQLTVGDVCKLPEKQFDKYTKTTRVDWNRGFNYAIDQISAFPISLKVLVDRERLFHIIKQFGGKLADEYLRSPDSISDFMLKSSRQLTEAIAENIEGIVKKGE